MTCPARRTGSRCGRRRRTTGARGVEAAGRPMRPSQTSSWWRPAGCPLHRGSGRRPQPDTCARAPARPSDRRSPGGRWGRRSRLRARARRCRHRTGERRDRVEHRLVERDRHLDRGGAAGGRSVTKRPPRADWSRPRHPRRRGPMRPGPRPEPHASRPVGNRQAQQVGVARRPAGVAQAAVPRRRPAGRRAAPRAGDSRPWPRRVQHVQPGVGGHAGQCKRHRRAVHDAVAIRAEPTAARPGSR